MPTINLSRDAARATLDALELLQTMVQLDPERAHLIAQAKAALSDRGEDIYRIMKDGLGVLVTDRDEARAIQAQAEAEGYTFTIQRVSTGYLVNEYLGNDA